MMTSNSKTKALLIGLLLITSTLFNACKKDDEAPATVKPDLVFVGLTSNGILQTYNANNVTSATASVAITGLQSGETLLAIDYRPATGQLYGLGSTSRLYIVNQNSGLATVVGSGPFTPVISGKVAGFDFNPTVDRIRLVTNEGQNLRLNPETATVVATDGNINGVTGAAISSAAYTNNKAGATTTILFDLDVVTKKLYKQDPPNNGILVAVGDLSIPTSSGNSSFDISPNGIALASIGNGAASKLYQINIETGAATDLGAFAGALIGLAIPTEPVAYAVDDMNNLIIFNPSKGTDQITKPLTGVPAGETFVGIDLRPVNGQLYALSTASKLYTINLANGAVAQVGTLPLATLLSGTSFGFDFNPTVDRIRVVSNTGQNLRLDPNTGLVAAIDGTLNPGTPMVNGAAYTNNFPSIAGTGATTVLFDIDSSNDRLYRQDPPNSGGLVEIGALGVNVEATNGFDIGGKSNLAYAILTVGTTTKLYTINLTTGVATAGVDFPKSLRGFALGLGF